MSISSLPVLAAGNRLGWKVTVAGAAGQVGGPGRPSYASAVIVKRLVLPAGIWYRAAHEPSPSFADDDGATRDAGTLDSRWYDSAACGVAEPNRGARG